MTEPITNRWHFFDEQGAFRQVRSTVELSFGRRYWGPYLTADGLDFWYMGYGQQPYENGARMTYHLMWADWDSLRASERFTFTDPPSVEEEKRLTMAVEYPHSHAVDGAGRAWVNHVLDYQIEVFEPGGGRRWRVRRDYEPVDYPRSYRDLIESGPQMMGLPKDVYMVLPPHQPAIQGMVWTGEDAMWVFTKAYVDSPLVQVDVFDEEGVYRRTFLADEGLARAQVGTDHLVWFTTLEDGTPVLKRSRFELIRSEPGGSP